MVPNAAVMECFSGFDKVLEVLDDFTEIEKVRVKTWMRNVRLETSNPDNIPHILKFACGTRMLLTMAWRPPLCLKYQQLGYIRKDCPNKRYPAYEGAVTNKPTPQEQPSELTSSVESACPWSLLVVSP